MIRKPICDKCGTPCEPGSKRCKRCQKEYDKSRESRATYFRQYNANRTKIYNPLILSECEWCGYAFIKSGGRQKRCTECRTTKTRYGNPLRSSAICHECGVEFECKRPNMTKWCPKHKSYNSVIKLKAQERNKTAETKAWKSAYYKERGRLIRESNPEKYAQQATVRALKRDAEKNRHNSLRYRAKKMGAPGDHTLEQWQEILGFYEHCCVDCGRHETERVITVGHAVPLALGGSNWPRNLIPQCGPCNTSQGKRYVHRLADPEEVRLLGLESIWNTVAA